MKGTFCLCTTGKSKKKKGKKKDTSGKNIIHKFVSYKTSEVMK